MNRSYDRSPIDNAYICPAPFTLNRSKQEWETCNPDALFAWTQQHLQDSRSFLRLQPAYKYIATGMDIVNGDNELSSTGSLSSVRTDLTLRNSREIVAAQTNLKIIPEFKSPVEDYREQSAGLNKAFGAWQNMTFADRRIRSTWQYACIGGTGYVGPRYDPNYYYRGKGDIVWDSYGPLDVLPLGLPPGLNIQRAYSVALRKSMPIHEVWRMFPLQRDNIKANRVTAMGKGTVIAQSVKFASAVIRRFGQGARKPDEATTWDTTDVYYIYVDDDSVNETGHPIQIMGPDGIWGTSWSYTVPYVGQQIKTGRMLGGGQPETKTAKREDCLIYPNRRLIIATDTCVINPSPEHQSSYRWDGRGPIVQFRADDWAWNFLGFPVTRYGAMLERMGTELWRGVNDQMNQRLNPSSFYDRGAFAKSNVENINPRIPGLLVGMDMNLNPAATQFSPILPYQWSETSAIIVEVASKIIPSFIKEQMGVADVSAMSRARQLPSGDSTEKLLEAMGPLIKDESRNMEESIRMLGEMWKSDWFQFATAKRRMQMLGPDGVTQEDYDFDPGTMIPLAKDKDGKDIDHDFKTDFTLDTPARMPDLSVPAFERARWHKSNFTFTVTPYSLHEFNSTTRRLFILQLMKTGFPLSWWTQAEMFDVKNFGPCMFKDPETGELREARNEIEKWTVQLEIMARVAQAQGGGGGGKGKGGRGRPETFQRAPVLEQKSRSGSPDATVRTSAH